MIGPESPPEPAAGFPESYCLDEEHILEPLDAEAAQDVESTDPVVVDAAGRMWRLRPRRVWSRLLTAGAALLQRVGVSP